jgi:asparaginyl-tRNA synthetase
MTTLRIRDAILGSAVLGAYTIVGWVKTHRQSKNVSFIELSDGTSVKGLQIVIEPGSVATYTELAARIGTGAALEVEGELVPSPAKGQKFEFKATKVTLLGEADPEQYPLQKKGHSFEFLREIAHLRPRTNSMGAVFRVRSAAAMAVHTFFQKEGFYYVHAPIITTADCEGAGEMFRVTTLDQAKPPMLNGAIDYSQDFFKAQAGLTVSGQLEAECFATAISKVYTFGPTFRAENSNTARHLSEFWMIEPEMAFCDLQGDMRVAESFVKFMISYVLEHCTEEMEFFEERIEKGIIEAVRKVADSKFEALDYTAAIAILEKCGKKFEYPVKWGMDLQSEHERYLAEEHVKGPVFVVNYPKDIKAFYMRLNDDGKTVRAMDLLVPRVGELIGGSQREERYDHLVRRMQEMKIPEKDLWWYLELRKFGTVPHAGFGLGFERFMMYITGMQNIRDVIPFPRFPGGAQF